jgi:hypothetical protein
LRLFRSGRNCGSSELSGETEVLEGREHIEQFCQSLNTLSMHEPQLRDNIVLQLKYALKNNVDVTSSAKDMLEEDKDEVQAISSKINDLMSEDVSMQHNQLEKRLLGLEEIAITMFLQLYGVPM